MIPAALPAPAPATDAKTVATGGEGDAETTFAHVLGQMFVLGSAGEDTPDPEAEPDGSMGVPAEAIAEAGVEATAGIGAGAEDGTADEQQMAAGAATLVAVDVETESDVQRAPNDGDANRPSTDRVADRRGLNVAQAHAAEPARMVTSPPGPDGNRSSQQTSPQTTGALASPTGGSQPLQTSASAEDSELFTSPPPSQSPVEGHPRAVSDLVATPASAASPTSSESASAEISLDGEVDVGGDVDADVAGDPAMESGEDADATSQRTIANTEDGDPEQPPTRRGPGNEAIRTDTPSAAPTTPGASSPSADRAHGATATDTAAASETAAPADAPTPVNAPAPPATVTASAAPAAPAPAPAPAPVPAQIVDHVTPLLQKGDGTHEVTIELDPVDLGRVRLEITLDDGVVSVRVHADDPATRRLLAASMHELRASLTEAGVSAGDLDVRDGDVGGRDRPEAGERRQRDSASDEGRAAPGDRSRPRTSSRSALDVLL